VTWLLLACARAPAPLFGVPGPELLGRPASAAGATAPAADCLGFRPALAVVASSDVFTDVCFATDAHGDVAYARYGLRAGMRARVADALGPSTDLDDDTFHQMANAEVDPTGAVGFELGREGCVVRRGGLTDSVLFLWADRAAC
jgi:hypothetical protein